MPTLPELEPLSEATQTPRSGQSWVPAPTASAREVEALERVAESRGAVVRKAPEPVPSGPMAVRVQLGDDVDLRLRGGALRRLAPWLCALGLSLAGTVGGAVGGYFDGLQKARETIAELRETDRLLREEDARARARSDALAAAIAAEAASNRTERATRDRQHREIAAEVEERLPKVEANRPPRN